MLVHGLAVYNAGCLALQWQVYELAADWTATVDWFTKDVDNTAEQTFAHRNRGDFASAAHFHALGNFVDIVEQDYAYVAFLKVESNAFDAVFEFYQLVGAHVVEAIDVGYAVADFEYAANFFKRYFGVDILELLF